MTSIERVPFDINEQINGSTQQYFGPLQYVNRCRGCNKNLTSNNPASRYQILKQIQNTVRVPSSLYSMNIGALNVYQRPNTVYSKVELDNFGYIVSPGVNWNQMSDRKNPHIQKVVSASGSTYGGNSLKRTLTRLRPGALSPGGVGVDIKHNSYDRYLARIKGKGPLRRGPVPKIFLSPYIPFDPAYPVYGSKLTKTSIVNGCDCPNNNGIPFEEIYRGKNSNEIFDVKYIFHEGDIVLIPLDDTNKINQKAKVIEVLENGELLKVVLLDSTIERFVLSKDVKIFLFDRCEREINPCILKNNIPQEFAYISDGALVKCLISNYIPKNLIV